MVSNIADMELYFIYFKNVQKSKKYSIFYSINYVYFLLYQFLANIFFNFLFSKFLFLNMNNGISMRFYFYLMFLYRLYLFYVLYFKQLDLLTFSLTTRLG